MTKALATLLIALVWTHKFCFTSGAVAQVLNGLPEARAQESKVIGNDKMGYTVFYRIEEDLPVPVREEEHKENP